MEMFLNAAAVVGATVLAAAIGLTLLPRLGRPGRFLADVCARAPMLDVVFAALSWVPWLAAGLAAGWAGVAGALVGQVAAVLLWTAGHELAHPATRRGSRLYKAQLRGAVVQHRGDRAAVERPVRRDTPVRAVAVAAGFPAIPAR